MKEKDLKEWLGNSQIGTDIVEKKYLQKKDNGEYETLQEWSNRIANGNKDYIKLFLDKKFIPGGRILSNRGIDNIGIKSTLSNCYVLSTDDSIEAIYKTCSDMARTYSYGGGVGVDISQLRPNGAVVNNSARTTTGAVSFMKTFDVVTGTIGQHGRRGALMISISANHPDLPEFIDIKANTDQINNANISVRVNNEFMEAVKNDEDYILRWPCDKKLPNINKETLEYNKLTKINDCDNEVLYVKKIRANELFKRIAKNNWDYGEPGVLYWDKIENYHLMSHNKDFKYAGVNPCLTGDTLIRTDKGDRRLDEIVKAFEDGEAIKVLTYDCRNESLEYQSVYFGALTAKSAKVMKIITEDNTVLRLTPDHKVYKAGVSYSLHSWVEAKYLTSFDDLLNIERKPISVEDIIFDDGVEDVYDISVECNHNFFANGLLVHNCAEEVLPDGGACLLGSMNLYEYVKENKFQWEDFDKDVRTATRWLNDIQEENIELHPLEIQRQTAKQFKQIGLGIFDLAGALIKLGITYGSSEAKDFADKVTHQMLISAFEQSCDLNTEGVVYEDMFNSTFYKERVEPYIKERYKGKYPLNSQLLTIAPTGSISTMVNAGAGGGEPLFRISYTRDTKSIGEKTYHICSNAVLDYFNGDHYAVDESILPEYYITSDKIKPIDRIEMQAALQKNIDASISSTINLPKTATINDVYDIYMNAWSKGLKGVTIFRDGCKRTAILNTTETSKENNQTFSTVNAVKRPKVLEGDYYQVSIKGESFIIIVGLYDGKPYELFALPNENNLKIKNHKGKITKVKKRVYKFESEFITIDNIAIELEKDYNVMTETQKLSELVYEGKTLSEGDINQIQDKVKRIINWCDKKEYRNVALHVSSNLRTGMRIEDIIKVEEKCCDSIISFPKAISRVLSKYQESVESTELCPECGTPLIKEGGCCHCTSCGWSACG